MKTEEICQQLDSLLLTVQKPGRYVGGEYNQVVKAWGSVQTHVALVFPDLYDIGLPNLGLAILYDTLNRRPDLLAERAYCPWVDMEAAMRSAGIPLYSLEGKHPLRSFDIIGFSIPYETLYTNVLNALDLAGIPIFSADRTAELPLIIAGGHSTFNPEPMAEFIDAFVIGEGEEVIQEIINLFQAWKKSGYDRPALLRSLADLQGVYVPSLYEAFYNPDGTTASIQPQAPGLPTRIKKRIVPTLPPPVTHFLVPNIEVVHNRVAVEITRGCTRGCRFCHAGMISRPVRERPADEVLHALEEALQQTGYEEAALLSLSTSDYTHIVDLVQKISRRFQDVNLSVSLPSLRIDSFSVALMDELKELRPGGGFTLAPEAATERMRRIINKPVSTEQLLQTANDVFSHGWKNLKLYFMIGHPSETMEDVQAIADLSHQVLAVGRRVAGSRARVHVGVSSFIPKPHTPFQWVPCDSLEQIQQKLSLLKRALRNPNLKLSWTEPETTLLEAWLSRGDRRLSRVIHRAWQLGCKFDAWQDQFQFSGWTRAFQDVGLDPSFYSHRVRSLDEVMPWQHINAGVTPAFLARDYRWSLEGRLRADCRDRCTSCGITTDFAEVRLRTTPDAWCCPPAKQPVALDTA